MITDNDNGFEQNDDMFSFSGNVEQEDEGTAIPVNFDQSFQEEQKAPEGQAAEIEKTTEELEAEKNKGIDFDDELTKEKSTPEVKDEDKIIEDLKAKGYKIEKEEVVPANELQKLELDKIDGFINQATNFLAQTDEQICREKIKSDLAKQYTDKGKQHLIGSEEFEIDIDAEYSPYEDNEAMRKLYAENVRRDVKGLLQENVTAKEKINADLTNAATEKVKENRVQIQNSLKEIMTQGVFGLQATEESIKETYQFIVSGEFSKQVNNDPSLVAEFATYVRNRDAVKQSIGGPTYGEGVKAGIDALGVNKDQKSKSPLGQSMSTSHGQQSNTLSAKKAAWAMPTVEEEKKEENGFVAGRTR